jgi:type I restriction enzyme, R subunit
VCAPWRHGARLDSGDGDFDVSEYRPRTYALVREAVAVERLRDDLPTYRIDGSDLKRLDEEPGSPDEKAAEVERRSSTRSPAWQDLHDYNPTAAVTDDACA